MTSVSISTTKNTVTVDEDNPSVITVATQGPQGPAFSDGDLGDIVITGNGTIATIDNGAVNNAKIASDAAIALSKLATGALPTGITVASANIPDLTIVNSDISASAAISLSKLATGALPTAITVTSANISDLSILNADVNASAAIAGTKISPDFGSQNIVTTGNITIADVTAASLDISGNADIDGTLEADAYTVNGTALNEYIADTIGAMVSGNTETNIAVTYDDTDNTLDFSVVNITGNAATATALETARTIGGTSFDGSANIDISYNNLTNKLSVGDGGLTQNNFTDTLKTKLDGIETAATADQTAAEILIAIKTVDGSTSGLDADLLDGRDTSTSGTANTIALRDANGDLFATTFSGSGASLTSLPASQLTGAIANGVTATTQSASDNSTKIATTAYADTAIANLVDSSPSALNTLNELAAALGDDANFSTTVTNSIATKLPLAGGTLTGTLEIAASTCLIDLMETSTTNHRIRNGNGNFYIQRISDDKNTTTNQLLIDGGTGAVELYYNGSKKIETASDKILFHAHAKVNADNTYDLGASGARWKDLYIYNDIDIIDNGKILLGTGDDLQIYHDGTHSFIKDTGTGSLKICSNSLSFRNAADGEDIALFLEDGRSELYYDNAKKLETTSTGINVTGVVVDDGATHDGDMSLNGASYNSWWDKSDSAFKFDDNAKLKVGTGGDLQIYHDGSHSYVANTGGNLYITEDGYIELSSANGGEKYATFNKDGAVELYHDGDLRLQTWSDGVNIHGDEGEDAILHLYADNGDDNADKWRLRAETSGNFNIQNYASGGWETSITGVGNGAVELYHDNSKKLETVSWGAKVTGNLETTGSIDVNEITINGTTVLNSSRSLYNLGTLELADNIEAKFGTGSDLKIYHNGSNTFLDNFGTGSVVHRVQNGDIYFQYYDGSSAEDMAVLKKNGAVELYYDNSKKLETDPAGVKFNDDFYVLDSNRGYFGTGNDLSIYHNSTNSYITNTTGNLVIDNSSGVDMYINSGNDIYIRPQGSDTGIELIGDGKVALFYDSSKKLETYSSGVEVTGTLFIPDGGSATNRISVGDGGDLKVYHDGTNSVLLHNGDGDLIVATAAGEKVYVDTSTFEVRNASSNESLIKATENGAVELYYDGTKKCETTSGGIDVDGSVTANDIITAGALIHEGDTDTLVHFSAADTIDLKTGGTVRLTVNNWGTSLGGNLNSNGNSILLGDSGSDTDDRIRLGESQDLQIYHDAYHSYLHQSGTGELKNRAAIWKVVNEGNSEIQIKATENEAVELYYDHSLKFHTRTDGVRVIGDATWSDNGKARFGPDGDLALYHDGTNSWVLNTTGNLILKDTTDAVYIQAPSIFFQDDTTNEDIAKFISDGAVELYYDNSKKLETKSYGIQVAGGVHIQSDSERLWLGADSDLHIYHDGSDNFIKNAVSGRNLKITHSDDAVSATFYSTSVALNYSGSKKFETTSWGADVTGTLRADTLQLDGDDQKLQLGADQDWEIYHDGTDNYFKTGAVATHFRTDNGNRLTIKASGDVQMQGSSGKNLEWVTATGLLTFADNAQATFGTGNDMELWHNGTYSAIKTDNLKIVDKTNGHGMITALVDGAVGLRYDNVEKIATTSTGVTLFDGLILDNPTNAGKDIQWQPGSDRLAFFDNTKATFGDGVDLQIYFDGTNSFIKEPNSVAGQLVIDGYNGTDIRQGSTGDLMGRFIGGGAVELYWDGSKKLHTHTGGVTVTGYIQMDGTEGSAAAGNIYIEDNGKIVLGNAPDLEIYHDGNHSQIKDSGTGNLQLLSSAFKALASDGSETYISAVRDGAVELYYDNSKKFETNSTGTKTWGGHIMTNGGTITGGDLSFADSSKAKFGDGNDLQIYHDGTNSYIVNGADGGTLYLQTYGENSIKCLPNAAVELYYNGTKKLQTHSEGIDTFGRAEITVTSSDTDFTNESAPGYTAGGIIARNLSQTNGCFSALTAIAANGAATSQSASFIAKSVTSGHAPEIHLVQRTGANAQTTALKIDSSQNATFAGTVTCTSLTETSDIALKTNIEPITNVLDKINQITGYKYDFTSSNSSSIGVIAQDVEKVFPELVHGEEGSKSLQYSGLVGALIESVKELSAKVAALEAGS